MSLWYVYAMWRDRLCQRRTISAQLPIRCHALYWSPYQKRDPLSNDHTGQNVSLFYGFGANEIVPAIWSNLDYEQRIYEIDGFPSKGWMNCLSNCFLSQQNDSVECVCGRSADLILKNVMGLSVLRGVCVCARTLVWVSVLCATIRLNPELSLTGLAEWTAEVYHCLLISSDSHQPIRVGHSLGVPRGNRRCWPGLTHCGQRIWVASKKAPIFPCQEKSNKSKLSGATDALCSAPWWQNTVWLHLK